MLGQGPEDGGPEGQELAGEAGETRSPQGPAVAVSRPTGGTGAGAKSRKANKKGYQGSTARSPTSAQARRPGGQGPASSGAERGEPRPAVYGDGAYGARELLAYLQEDGTGPQVKAQPPSAPGGLFT